MYNKGFTIIELLTGIIIIIVIVLIALPLGAIRAKRHAEKNMKVQMVCIKEAEEAYKTKHGTYTSDETKLANWKQTARKYHFRIRDASIDGFIVEARADLDNDRIFDTIWTIDQNGVLANIK